MPDLLNKVHCQRIARAVAAARSGARVQFRAYFRCGDAQIAWVDSSQHVIATVPTSGVEMWSKAIQEEYEKQLHPIC